MNPMPLATLTDITFAEMAAQYTLIVADTAAEALAEDATDPILVDATDELLDGFHRVAGYLAALAASPELADEDVRMVIVHNEDVAALVAEPGGAQCEAIALCYAVAL
jgi:hypothetical protein